MEIFFDVIVYVFVFLFGVCIGSFLNVCIYRLPLGESLTKRNSHCMTCGEYIKRRDLIPIISWCLLKGKCRSCGAKISPRYTVVEALNGVLFLLVFIRFNVVKRMIFTEGLWLLLLAVSTCIMFSALVVIFFMDWDTQLINDWVVLVIAIMAIPRFIAEHGLMNCEFPSQAYDFPDLKSHIIGIFVASVPLLIIAVASKERAMGYGDVTLMAAGGFFLGIEGSIIALLIGLVTASVMGLILKHINGDSKFAFGPYLSIGIAVAALFAPQIGNWYMDFTGLNKTAEEMARMLIAMI